jgi:hypothetical protein
MSTFFILDQQLPSADGAFGARWLIEKIHVERMRLTK